MDIAQSAACYEPIRAVSSRNDPLRGFSTGSTGLAGDPYVRRGLLSPSLSEAGPSQGPSSSGSHVHKNASPHFQQRSEPKLLWRQVNRQQPRPNRDREDASTQNAYNPVPGQASPARPLLSNRFGLTSSSLPGNVVRTGQTIPHTGPTSFPIYRKQLFPGTTTVPLTGRSSPNDPPSATSIPSPILTPDFTNMPKQIGRKTVSLRSGVPLWTGLTRP